MAGNDFQVKGLMSIAVAGLSDISRMTMFLNQAANAGGNSARAFQSLQIAASYATQSVGKFVDTFKSITGHALQFEDTMARAAGVTNNNVLQLANMRATAMTLSDTIHGPNELAKALLELNRAGIEGSQALNDVKTVSDLALITQTDLATATTALANVYKAWGGPLDTSAKLLDKFAAAANTSTFEMKSLLKAMEYVQRGAIPLGVSLETSLAGLMLMAPITGPNSKAGTSLGGAMTRLSNPATIKALQAEKIDPYGKGGTGRRSPFDVWADVYEKYGRSAPSQKSDAMIGKVFGTRDRAVLAMISKAYTEGFAVDTPNGKKTLYGRQALRAAEGSLGSGMTLAGQASEYRKTPAGAWKMLGAQWEKLMLEVGAGFLETFMTIRRPIEMVINGLRGLNSMMGGTLQYTAMLFGAMGLMKIGSMGLGAVGKSMAWFGGMTPGPTNPTTGSARAMAAGQSVDALFYAYQGANRMGYTGSYRARSQAHMAGAAGSIVDPLHREAVLTAIGQHGINFTPNLTAAERVSARTPELDKALKDRSGVRGKWAEWHNKYGGFSGVAASMRDYGTSGMNLGARVGGTLGALIPGSGGIVAGGLLGGGIGGSIGAVGGALTSVASSALSILGPLAAFGGLLLGGAYAMERYQKAEESQQRNALKQRGLLNDMPTLLTGAMTMGPGGQISSDMLRLLNNNKPGTSYFSSLITTAKELQDQTPGMSTNQALAKTATMFQAGISNEAQRAISSASSSGLLDRAGQFFIESYHKIKEGDQYAARGRPFNVADAQGIKKESDKQLLATAAIAAGASGGIDLSTIISDFTSGTWNSVDRAKFDALLKTGGPMLMGATEEFSVSGARAFGVGSRGGKPSEEYLQDLKNGYVSAALDIEAKAKNATGDAELTAKNADIVAAFRSAVELFQATSTTKTDEVASAIGNKSLEGLTAMYLNILAATAPPVVR